MNALKTGWPLENIFFQSCFLRCHKTSDCAGLGEAGAVPPSASFGCGHIPCLAGPGAGCLCVLFPTSQPQQEQQRVPHGAVPDPGVPDTAGSQNPSPAPRLAGRCSLPHTLKTLWSWAMFYFVHPQGRHTFSPCSYVQFFWH